MSKVFDFLLLITRTLVAKEYIVMHCLTSRLHSEKCIIRQFYYHAYNREYANLLDIV
jgi:hypothetical protein